MWFVGLPYAVKNIMLPEGNISTGAHPAIYSAVQLHVVNRNQCVLKGFKIRKQMEKWCEESCQEIHTFSLEKLESGKRGRTT